MARSSAGEVADFFVCFCHETGSFVSNLELQKYLYYAQGWFLAIYDEPLFDEELQAWIHGPVHPATYRRFKHNSWNSIGDKVERPELDETIQSHLREVYEAYGRFSGWDLERMTHDEGPWREARGDLPDDEGSSEVITHESMRRYFGGRLKDSE